MDSQIFLLILTKFI